MKIIFLILLSVLFLGCNPIVLDQTPVRVKIISVKTIADYKTNSTWTAGNTYPHVVVERLDTGERMMIQYDTWGKTGDVFVIKQCNLHW